MHRQTTKPIQIGNVWIGGGHPIAIQSMTNTKTEDVAATVAQIQALSDAGCHIVRCAVPNMAAARALSEIKEQITIPLVADIHFDYRLAIEAMSAGADKIRINPGNIGSKDRVKAVVDAAKQYHVPIRVGVNSGSLEKHILEKYGAVTPEGLVESAIYNVRLLESFDFDQIVVSIKASDVMFSVRSHELAIKELNYPFHIGITESGTVYTGTLKSSVGLGIMLYQGIGDTLRVSLTGDPVQEIFAARKILETLELVTPGVQFVSCPTCGRTNIDLIGLAEEIEKHFSGLKKPIKIAVMGCAVNGPGEAKEADIGVAGGQGEGLIFMKGQIVKKVPEAQIIPELKAMIDTFF